MTDKANERDIYYDKATQRMRPRSELKTGGGDQYRSGGLAKLSGAQEDQTGAPDSSDPKYAGLTGGALLTKDRAEWRRKKEAERAKQAGTAKAVDERLKVKGLDQP